MLCLQFDDLEAVLDEFSAVEKLVHHLECVVGQLRLVHQVFHESHHHFCLSAHILQLVPDFRVQLQEAID